jgi:hypothetical protein
MTFPLQETCDPTNPEEAFLWMLVALPYQQGGQLVMPVPYLRMVSQRLWDCGARPTADATIRYEPPTGVEPNWMTAPGVWVPADAPARPRYTAEDVVAGLNTQQKAEFRKALEGGRP